MHLLKKKINYFMRSFPAPAHCRGFFVCIFPVKQLKKMVLLFAICLEAIALLICRFLMNLKPAQFQLRSAAGAVKNLLTKEMN